MNGEGKKIATIIDVAQRSGTSISTVSRVINGKGGVSPELETRILAAIRDLRYRPNSVAQALKNKNTRLIGLIIPSVCNPIFSLLVKEMEKSAEAADYSILLCNSDGSIEKEIKYLELMVKNCVEGIIFNATGIYDERFLLVAEANIPLLLYGKKLPGLTCRNITLNNQGGAYRAVEHLIITGSKHIAFVFGQYESISATEDRFAGYRQALQANSLPFDERLVIRTQNAEDDGGRYATGLLLEKAPYVDAIFASNDIMAMGCLDELLRSGKRVPEDIAVMGYDGIPYVRMVRPSLSTIGTPTAEMGAEAVRIILDQISGADNSASETLFEPILIAADSTKTP